MPRWLPSPFIFLLCSLPFAAQASAQPAEDPYLWLEEVESPKALQWAAERSAADTAVLEALPEYKALHRELLEIYSSSDRLPSPRLLGGQVYDFWLDPDHVRGIWRRTSIDELLKDKPTWETVLDLDALGEAEGENWVWHGAECLPPAFERCMLQLSRGGADAVVSREFDTAAKSFVEAGFRLDEAKMDIEWLDKDTLWVATDFGDGTLNTSGYPRILKEWTRGTPLDSAKTLFEADADTVFTFGVVLHTAEDRYDVVSMMPKFFRGKNWLRLGGRTVLLDLPEDASLLGIFKDRLILSLRSDWTPLDETYGGGSLLAIDVDDLLQGSKAFDVLFEPTERTSLGTVSNTRNHLLVSTLDNVRGRLFRFVPESGGWRKEEILVPGLDGRVGFGSIEMRSGQWLTVGVGSASEVDDTFFFTYSDFTTPKSLYLVRDGAKPVRVKSSPAWFDTEEVEVQQNEAVSADGTRIPYFLVTPRGFEANGSAPTLMTGYGGFEVSYLPSYSARAGRAWIGRGGVYVVANIRGGGEFGPKWHEAAIREKHQTNFDDFIAVAEDLVRRHITSPEHLGIIGGSQGGLLVGGAFTQRPELFGAVVCAVPLLDMKRFNKLLAGASWMSEYGNPDTDDWNFMKTWSPYQNLDPRQDYPPVYFWTNTRDDRVHPAHARKMVAKMTAMGKKVFYYENTEGGHGGGANLEQMAYTDALNYAFLWSQLR